MRLSLFFLCLLIAFAPLPSFAKEKLLDIQVVKSSGGLTAWLIEDHSVPVVSLEASFRGAGAAGDPADKQGLARMASNTMDEGAGSLDSQAFQGELRNKAIDLHFSAGRDHFGASLKTLSKNKARAFELLKLAVTQPRFDNEAIGRMREANLGRIRSSLADPQWMAARLLNDKAFAGHPYAMNSGGTLSSLQNITSADLKGFHTSRIGKNNLVVAVAGDITPEDLAITLDDVFGGLPEVEIAVPEDFSIQNGGKIFVYERDIPQTVVEIMQPGIARDDPDFQTAQVMNFIFGSSGFGSRLTEEIREKRGLTYGIYSSFYDLDHVQGLNISTSTKNESIGEMLALIEAEMKMMIAHPVSEEELQTAKDYLIGSLPLSLTSTDRIAGLLLSLQLDGRPVDYLDQRAAAIRATTTGDIRAVAARLLRPDDLTTILVGPKPSLEAVEVVKELPNVE